MREDWIEIELDKISTKITDGTHHTPTYINNGIHFISVKDVYNGKVNFQDTKFISKEKHEELIKRCKPESGDLLITKSGTIGRMAIVPETPEFSLFVSVALIKNRKEIILSKFLMYVMEDYLKSISISQVIKGGLLKNFHLEDIRKTIVKLPPISIQHAIVTKIENLSASLEKGIADLKKAQEQLKIYRQAVLKKAFEGELTKKWREKQTNLPTADELLEQIKEERQKHYEQQLTDWKQAVKEWELNGKEAKKPKKPKTIAVLPNLSEEELNDLPKTSKLWTWCKIDKIAGHNINSLKAGPFGSSLKKEFYTPKGYKIYGQEQVISGDAKFGDYYVDETKYNDLINCAVFPSDILISLVGTVGKVLVLPADAEMGIINPRLVKITLNSFYDSIFFKYYFESSFLKNLYKVKNHGTTMDVLNMTSIKELPYPLCTKEEQQQIVKQIESRLSVCDKVEQNIMEGLEKSEALRQSILKKAFEGKLLSETEIEKCKQEADYEPASELLKKIKAERK